MDGSIKAEVGRQAQVDVLDKLLPKGDIHAASGGARCSSIGATPLRSEMGKVVAARLCGICIEELVILAEKQVLRVVE